MVNRRILIIDDSVEIHNDFRKTLAPKKIEDQGLSDLEAQLFSAPGGSQKNLSSADQDSEVLYQLDSAYQGEEGYKMILDAQKNKTPYALAFVDVRMPPGWDGIQTIKKIWSECPFIEIVICTAYSDYSLEDITDNLGLSHRLLFLRKPYDSTAVRQMALTLTTKWDFEEQTRVNIQDLETKVTERTASLIQNSKMVALGEMAGGIAHEINNPLAIITGTAQTLQRKLLEPDRKTEEIDKSLIKIIDTAERIAKIVTSLRSFSTGEAEGFSTTLPLKNIINDTLSLCSERFRINGVTLKVGEVDPSFSVRCNAVQISQVLLNLLLNAYDAIENTNDKWIAIEVVENSNQVEILLTNGGPGIPADLEKKIFQPFFTTKQIGKGTGLGLSVSHGITKSHGWNLFLDRRDPANKNTRFAIAIPKALAVAAVA